MLIMETDTLPPSEPSAPDLLPLSAPDALLWEALPALKLNIAQTAALCGISVRQLGYWTKQGYVKAVGRGARRLYGLDALRRILTIRKTMSGGASLRQSVRALSAGPPLPSPLPLHSLLSAPASPPPDADALADSLLALFARNRHTRDNANGLATKLGRAEDDVRAVAESLCQTGALIKTAAQGDIVFRRAPEKTS